MKDLQIEEFRVFVNKVLPTVYNDALTYSELLNKVLHHLNLTIDQVNLLSQNMDIGLKQISEIEAAGIKNIQAGLDEIETAIATIYDKVSQEQHDEILVQLGKIEQKVEFLEVRASYIKIESWADVQKVVRDGFADKFFSVGDQFTAKYDGVDYLWDIIGINHDEPANPDFIYSMTIQSRDCLMNCVFDAPEPTNPDGNIKLSGSNNYLKSNIRQWLNSSDAVFNFAPQSAYDVKPSVAPYNGAGFLYKLDPELKSVIGLVKKQVAKNTVTDGGGQDLFEDKVFLISRVEAFGGGEGVVTGEKPYDYYNLLGPVATTGELAGRIKYLSGVSRYWWLRSPLIDISYNSRVVYSTGTIISNSAYYAGGLSPACTIY